MKACWNLYHHTLTFTGWIYFLWRSLLACTWIKLTISPVLSSPKLHTSSLTAILYTFVTQTTHTINKLAIVTCNCMHQTYGTRLQKWCRDSERLSEMRLRCDSAANQKASSKNRKASSENRKVFSEESEGFFRRVLGSYTHKFPKHGAASLTYLPCSRLDLPRSRLGLLRLRLSRNSGPATETFSNRGIKFKDAYRNCCQHQIYPHKDTSSGDILDLCGL